MEDQIREIARQEAEKLFNERLATLSQKSNHITLKEAKKEFDLFGATLYRHVDKGHLSLIKLGGKSFLLRSEIEALFVKVK
ncbi:MAG: hypothetical protein WD824_19660 [Cyclobacteriaceae bacterium]